MKLQSFEISDRPGVYYIEAWVQYDEDHPLEVCSAELSEIINRSYKNLHNIVVVHKTPAEIGGVFELFGTYAIKAYANKRGWLSRIKQRLCADAPITDKED